MSKPYPRGMTLKLKCKIDDEGGSAEIVPSYAYENFRSLPPVLRLDIINDAEADLARERLWAEAAMLGAAHAHNDNPPSWQSVVAEVRGGFAPYLMNDEDILLEFDLWSGHELLEAYKGDNKASGSNNVVPFPASK